MDLNSKKLKNILANPTKWAETFLRDPNDSSKPLRFRSYQKWVTDNSREYSKILLRYGRRTGKSVCLCVDTLWWASINPLVKVLEGETEKESPMKILLVTPYENQIKMLFETYMALVSDSPLLKDQIEKVRTSDVYSIEFKNGSRIEGHTIGISSSNRGTSLRGMSADMIFIDEMDYIPRDIIEQVIMPIWTTHTKCKLRICSTPTGKHELFHYWATHGEELGWLTLHCPSWHPDNPGWLSIEEAKKQGIDPKDSTELQVKSMTAPGAYIREYGAEFGEEEGGVYKPTFIDKSLSFYGENINVEDVDVFDPKFEQKYENIYIMGVDWNSYINGGQIVIVEYCAHPTFIKYYSSKKCGDVRINCTGKYRLFYRCGIKSKEATQRKTREKIIELMRTKKIDFIYVDYGAGDTNIEELTHFGNRNPGYNLNQKLKVVDSGAVVDHYDPILREKVKKRNKSLMVNFSVLSLEQEMLVLPREEDHKTRLIGQMRGYKVKNQTHRGDYTYEGEDHILDAFNLAMYGFQREYGSLMRNKIATRILRFEDPRTNSYPTRQIDYEDVEGPVTSQGLPNRDPEQKIIRPKKVGFRSKIIRRSFMSGGRKNF